MGIGRRDAARGVRRIAHIVPSRRDARLRNARRGDRPPAASAATPPENAAAAALSLPRVHSIAAWASAFMVSDGVLMALSWLPTHGDGAVIDQAHHRIDRPFRIGAIADDIAEADDPLRARAPARNRGTR